MARQDNEDRDCSSCSRRRPEINGGLAPYWACFLFCETQLRVGMSGVYALDWPAIFCVAESLALPVDTVFTRLLKVFEGAMMKEITKRRKEDDG